MKGKTKNLHKNELKEEMLFIGSDSNSKLYYIKIPEMFIPYKENLNKAIDLAFYSSFSNIVPKTFISNMKSRDVLHKFIGKHTASLLSTVKTEKELELLIQKEFKKMFNIDDEKSFKRLYKQYDKGSSIEKYAYKFYKRKLLDYKDRLDKVEL